MVKEIRIINKYITNKLTQRENRITNPINPKGVKEWGRGTEKAIWDKQRANDKKADLNPSISVITLKVNDSNALKDKGCQNR